VVYDLTSLMTDTAPTNIYPLSLHDALPISAAARPGQAAAAGWCGPGSRSTRERHDPGAPGRRPGTGQDRAAGHPARAVRLRRGRSEEHTSELQSLAYLVCRLLLEKKKN